MVNTVVRLEWHDKVSHHHRCFNFLLEMFKLHYLPKICPKFCYETSLYNPNLELPIVRKPEADNEFVTCRVSLIKWVANYMHQTKSGPNSMTSASSPGNHGSQHEDDIQQDISAHTSLDSISVQTSKTTSDEEFAAQIVRDVFCSSRDNVNFIHELYRQAFLLNFAHTLAIRKTITVYKDIIQMNLPELPPYVLEPIEDSSRVQDEVPEGFRPGRLRNDSYLGAIHKENLLVRAGLQNLLQIFMTHAANVFLLEVNPHFPTLLEEQTDACKRVFMTHAANVFLLEVNPHFPTLLEEQTDACKRVLNIYRYMVMHTRMDNGTWEQLLLVLLQITSLVLGESPPKKKAHTLGGKLAPAIFQTLIVTWIKANLNVTISRELWDRFLHVLVMLTSWEELIKEWAKTLETLTRVLARHVYDIDLTDLPLDRLSEQKVKRSRVKGSGKQEMSTSCTVSESSHLPISRQGSSLPDGTPTSKQIRAGLFRSYSETNLAVKRRSISKVLPELKTRQRRSHSLDNIRPLDNESTDRTRSPSPAPSSGIESTSIKDSPIQLEVIVSDAGIQDTSGEYRGVVCGGSVRGWLPDVAVILWRRMLGSLGDVNQISDPKLHAQVFEYLVKLTDTLIKIKLNQGVSPDNQSTPQPPELVPPLTLILPWCFEALALPDSFENGKLSALQLLCTVTLNCEPQHRGYLPHFYRALHLALISTKAPVYVALKHLGPRFLSLQLPGFSLLLLDLILACNVVLSSSDLSKTTPRSEAVSILGGLLSLPDDFTQLTVLEPTQNIQMVSCPDIKDHVVNILLRTGRREPAGMARCIALSALGIFVYRELTNQTLHPKVTDAMSVILLALKFAPEYGEKRATCLLLLVFNVLHKLITGDTANEESGLSQPSLNDDFDPNILLDNFEKPSPTSSSPVILLTKNPGSFADEIAAMPSSPTKSQQCHQAIVLCAKTILAHIVTHLGHFPMAIGAARLSSLVVEHDDVPNLTSDELSASIFTAPNIQLFMLNPNVIASLIELPALDLPGGGVTAGLSTANRQVRVLLRDLSGKACWDASILYRSPGSQHRTNPGNEDIAKSDSQKWQGASYSQPESLMIGNQSHLPQRAMRHRSPNVLPDTTNAAADLDQLDDLLQYLGHTSPECLESFDRKLNEPSQSPISYDLEQEAIGSVISERNMEVEYNRQSQFLEGMVAHPVVRPDSRLSATSSQSETSNQNRSIGDIDETKFQQCRLLFSQLGLTGWEHRKDLHLLSKTDRLLRELRNLDTQPCRETHKVAIIYVAPGQEDKNSILSNQGGSAAYEQFLASLAWEIELEGHTGFLGGLPRQGSTGLTAPYTATSFLEAIFHVATRMPGNSPEAVKII
ncbi:Rap/ran-GAP [Popillia japonica]|uniref:Rap/ran-GAP n=1 Tax=Popillia japonica TaxID=7064 RepID=A0AAW1IX15_POPJA